MAINKLSTVQGFNTPSRIGGATITDAATGNYTSGGVTYDYWTFTGNGSLNVVTAGYADVLVVGGGGSGAGADVTAIVECGQALVCSLVYNILKKEIKWDGDRDASS